MTRDQLLEEATAAFDMELRQRLHHVEPPSSLDGTRLGLEAADWAAAAALAAVGTSPVGRRIGPVYVTDELARWLVAPGRPRLTGEAVRKRAKERRLVAFRTDDGHWAFPAWQFTRAAGRLVPRAEVTALWRRLPHDSVLADADLAAWMSTEFEALASTPAMRAHEHGVDDERLAAAIARLHARLR